MMMLLVVVTTTAPWQLAQRSVTPFACPAVVFCSVFTVKFTGDARYILSGSDDTNIRIWKAQAAAPLHRTLPRERAKLDYADALKKRCVLCPHTLTFPPTHWHGVLQQHWRES